ncbi:3,4-dihydroxy-2-butanone 4-phosphate synthase-like protein [Delitschia confertaspora ATCC 74209]|uniref:3,4-dihydroxy-2-butanone 4-phosphate synthase n=1 Tax=Delitschia confertaspora ATCC 74209 TaxID=1513339 RepID=A0A9P4JS67_9PLEO|nr:3,4-dihydroxy-2-butanone 4-phosphate synthase-like protein [Delitschia confertaspora ATCC 74209]
MNTPPHPAFDSVPDIIQAVANDEFVIILDSPDRENEADLIIAASSLTPSKAAFMIRYTSGYLCTPMSASRAEELHLPQMVIENTDPNRTAYTVTVDASHPDITTGISATDRSLTCRMLADPSTKSSDFRRPGHIVPLQAREGGVRARRGHTEAAVDLCRLAGKEPVGVICEIVTDGVETENGKPELVGGGMMRRDEAVAFGKRWGIRVGTIEDMVRWIEEKEGRLPDEGVNY